MNNIAITTIVSYFVFCLLFFIIKQLVIDKDETYPNNSWIKTFIIFSFFIYLIQNIYYSSINSSNNEKCVVSFSVVLLSTLIPLIVILCPIVFLVHNLNWYKVFSNTIGLSVTQDVLDPNIDNNTRNIINDRIYQLDGLDNFHILNDMAKLQQYININKDITYELEHNVHVKLISEFKKRINVGYFMWFMLTGIITSLASANNILLQDCLIE
jgi:hypothetical protein